MILKSRGDRSSWLNLVACIRYDQVEADRTPREAGMRLLVTPYVPKGRR